MPSLQLVLGLTDKNDPGAFRFDPNDNNQSDKSISYNLFKQTPEIEKTTLSWTLKTELPGVLNAVNVWEDTIRTPHLNLITNTLRPHLLAPNYNNISLNIAFSSLFPSKINSLKEFEMADYENIGDICGFGDLCLEYNGTATADGNNGFETLLQYAYHHNTLEKLTPGPDPLFAVPTFEIVFELGNFRKPNFDKDPELVKWMTKNKDELERLGYSIDDPKSNFGTYVAGKLDQDPMEAYELLMKYRYVCRTSIVKGE